MTPLLSEARACIGIVAAALAWLLPTIRAHDAVPAPGVSKSALSWDVTTQEHAARRGEVEHSFVFNVFNSTDREIVIESVKTSCGCTVVDLPATPWRIAPAQGGELRAKLDWTGRYGEFQKEITVVTNEGVDLLRLKVDIPPPEKLVQLPLARARNLQVALADRQAVFRNACAKCHVEPAAGKTGRELYTAACAICHEAGARSPLVPDLTRLGGARDAEDWRRWIAHSQPGSLMPAFAASQGGPLTERQIDSLVEYLASWARTSAHAAGRRRE